MYLHNNNYVENFNSWKAEESPAGVLCKSDSDVRNCQIQHDCKYGDDCAHPGKGICVQQSSCSGSDCYDGPNAQSTCNSKNTCNESEGWTKNIDGTDCNIYKCTLNGKPFDRNKPENNGDNLYKFKNQICWRKGPGVIPGETPYCDGFDGCFGDNDPTSQTKNGHPIVNDGWGNFSCTGPLWGPCTTKMQDEVGMRSLEKWPLIDKPVDGGLEYIYARSNAHDERLCWFTGAKNIDGTDPDGWTSMINFSGGRQYPTPSISYHPGSLGCPMHRFQPEPSPPPQSTPLFPRTPSPLHPPDPCPGGDYCQDDSTKTKPYLCHKDPNPICCSTQAGFTYLNGKCVPLA